MSGLEGLTTELTRARGLEVAREREKADTLAELRARADEQIRVAEAQGGISLGLQESAQEFQSEENLQRDLARIDERAANELFEISRQGQDFDNDVELATLKSTLDQDVANINATLQQELTRAQNDQKLELQATRNFSTTMQTLLNQRPDLAQQILRKAESQLVLFSPAVRKQLQEDLDRKKELFSVLEGGAITKEQEDLLTDTEKELRRANKEKNIKFTTKANRFKHLAEGKTIESSFPSADARNEFTIAISDRSAVRAMEQRMIDFAVIKGEIPRQVTSAALITKMDAAIRKRNLRPQIESFDPQVGTVAGESGLDEATRRLLGVTTKVTSARALQSNITDNLIPFEDIAAPGAANFIDSGPIALGLNNPTP